MISYRSMYVFMELTMISMSLAKARHILNASIDAPQANLTFTGLSIDTRTHKLGIYLLQLKVTTLMAIII